MLLISGLTLSAQKYDYGTDSAECVKNLSLFNEYAKQDQYKDAYPFWKACVTLCPKSRKGLYTSGEKMFKSFIKVEKDETHKAALVDSLFMLYDMRIENFGQAGFVSGKKGVDMLKLRPEDPCAAAEVLKTSVHKLKSKSDASFISNYYTALYDCYKLGNTELETLFNEYLTLSDYINKSIEDSKPAEGDPDKVAKKKVATLERMRTAKSNLDEYFIGFADCEDIVKIFEKRIAGAPEDIDLKTKALRIMNRKECTENDLFAKVTRAVHAVQPTAESAYGISRDEASQKNYRQAITYMKECLDLCGDCAERMNYLKYSGYLAVGAGDYAFARKCANEMQQIEPNSGHPWIIKGDAAKASAGSCDDGKLGTYGAYWVATDYYQKAKAMDKSSSVQQIATSKINGMAGRNPKKADVFFHGKKKGDAYSSDCLGVSTTVRTID